MKWKIMPDSIASYKWNTDNIQILHNTLYLACIAYIDAYIENNFVHGDFHAGNLLLKKTNDTHTHPWICDFEKSYIKKRSPQTDEDFLYDIQKLFFLLPNMIHNIDKTNIMNIPYYINNIGIDKLKTSDLNQIIIDNINICKD
jgi:predicted unusual protein kinase regulating ubiquinone biosynthesis (AarF/ABC1/UbiB family)